MEVELSSEMRKGGHGQKWVYDSSVDNKGRVPLRASTGVWKASLFIIAIEFSERLSYFGLSTNLIVYLTKVLHEEIKTAAKNVNYWAGVTTLMPLVGGFVADAYLGRFSAIMASTAIYLAGLGLLTMSQFVPSLKPSNLRLHEVIFFVAMYLISVGTGGHKPALESFGADQFDDDHPDERKKKMSFFNWWNSGLCSGLLIGVTAVVYVQDHVGWGIADIILTVVMAGSLLIFNIGKPYYRYRVAEGSPLTPMLQVLVAAVAKRHLPLPADPEEFYEVPRSQVTEKRLLCHTGKLRFLDKAAIIESNGESKKATSPWRLATVTQVEETKLVVALVPIWLGTIAFGLCVAQASTFFIKQAGLMDRKLGSQFVIPQASIYSLAAVGMIISVCIYDKLLVPFLRRVTGNERGISILRRIGIGMAFSVVALAVAAVVEKERRRRAVKETGASPMNVFWLAPQFMILGFGDGFALVGLQEYFYDQVPDSMRSLGIAFYLSVIGAANFISGLLITVVDKVTSHIGKGWFANDLNKSRLDFFYWLLTAISALNLCVYVYLASRYTYKNVQKRVASAESSSSSASGDDDDVEKQ